jgi:hypothetical protein
MRLCDILIVCMVVSNTAIAQAPQKVLRFVPQYESTVLDPVSGILQVTHQTALLPYGTLMARDAVNVAAYTLARSPVRGRYPKVSDTSSPPCLLRLLPAGADAGRGLHPLEKRRLLTAHVESGPSTAQCALRFHRASKAAALPRVNSHGAAPFRRLHDRQQRHDARLDCAAAGSPLPLPSARR